MKPINAFLMSLIAGLSTLIGALIILFKISPKNITKFITLSLSFTVSIMIGISLFDLIPPSFFSIINNYSIFKSLIIIFISFLLGILCIFIIKKRIKNENDLYKLGILSMIALLLHNLPEGIATFMSSISDPKLGIKLTLAIMCHNIPEGISIAVPIYYATKSKKKAFFNTFLSAIAEPLGALITYLFLKPFISSTLLSIVLLFVAGLMIMLSINELFPKVISYKQNKFLFLGLILGLFIVILSIILF